MFKVLVNRLKPNMASLISRNQSVFLPWHLITNNILIAYEFLDSMQNQTTGRARRMAIKLDMSKAYDWIKLTFLEAIMLALKFQPH